MLSLALANIPTVYSVKENGDITFRADFELRFVLEDLNWLEAHGVEPRVIEILEQIKYRNLKNPIFRFHLVRKIRKGKPVITVKRFKNIRCSTKSIEVELCDNFYRQLRYCLTLHKRLHSKALEEEILNKTDNLFSESSGG